MRFVNITRRNIYNSLFGMISPGRTSADTKASWFLADDLKRIITACKGKVGIRLNDEEARLLGELMDLDEIGNSFDAKTIPEEIRNDPTGEKRAVKGAFDAHKNEVGKIKRKAVLEKDREAKINGEEVGKKPSGLTSTRTEEVNQSSLKSGFEKILEENERIKSDKKLDVGADKILNPFGNRVDDGGVKDYTHGAADMVPEANPIAGDDGANDATRSANASVPEPEVSENAGEMDRKAADVADALFSIGPATTKRRRGRKS